MKKNKGITKDGKHPGSENLIPLKPGYDPRRNYKGAPRKVVSTLNEIGYKNREISDTLLNILALTLDEIKVIADNEGATALERTIAKAILNGAAKGSLYNIETVITRAIGKPKEVSEVKQDSKIEVVFVKGKTIL